MNQLLKALAPRCTDVFACKSKVSEGWLPWTARAPARAPVDWRQTQGTLFIKTIAFRPTQSEARVKSNLFI